VASLVGGELPRPGGDSGMATLPLLLLQAREGESERERAQMREGDKVGAAEGS